jgi:GH15 family glucan-1,4-alpha-glucosidase
MTNDHHDLPIGDYALISDCHSSALVSRYGSIDWACLRRFDDGSTFARILDHDQGGAYRIQPAGRIDHTSRRYRPGTMVLETTLVTSTGTIRLTDAFAMRRGGGRRPRHELLRLVECVDGHGDIVIEITPRFDYGATRPWLQAHHGGRVSAVGGDSALAISADAQLHIDNDAVAVVGRVGLRAGDRLAVSVVAQPAHDIDVDAADAAVVPDRVEETTRWWTAWSRGTIAEGPHAELLRRSALTLKALTCAPSGALIAAPTTSLPEIPGGSANWDYRFCWIRDATLAIEALAAVGHDEVAGGFRRFLLRSAAGHGDELQILFGPYGERRLPEQELDLAGWRGSRPVRVGNAAANQYQLDVYGHIVDAVHVWHHRHHDLTDDEWRFLRSVVDQAAQRWTSPDAGIWEQRGDPQHFVHSKAMAWLALDRGIRLAADHATDPAEVERWSTTREEIRHAIDTRGVDPKGGNFVRAFGSTAVDASLLKLALIGYVEADDPRMVATVERICDELCEGGLIRRYRDDGNADTVDGNAEGVFLLCSCWLVEVLVRQGRRDEATEQFERVIATANDVGLFAEQYDPSHGELLGNFPQAFTHLGVIAAARGLAAGQSPPSGDAGVAASEPG